MLRVIAIPLQLIAIIIAFSVLVPHANVHQRHDLKCKIPLVVQSSVLFNPGAMRVHALTNAQKVFSQLLILRRFQDVNTQTNTQLIHTYKPKTLLRHHRKRPTFYSRG